MPRREDNGILFCTGVVRYARELLAAKVRMQEAVEVVHGHLHRGSVSSSAVSR